MTSRRTRQPPRRARTAPRKAVGRAQPARRTGAPGGTRTPPGRKAPAQTERRPAKAAARPKAAAGGARKAARSARGPARAQQPGHRSDYRLFNVHLPDERGALARLARTLAEARVNIDGFVANRGGVQVLTDEAAKADTALRQAAYHFQSVPVREAALEEKPGALANLAERLAWDWTSIESGFGLALGKRARVFLQVHEDQSSP